MNRNLLALLWLAILPVAALAYDFEVDGLLYSKTSDETVEVVSTSGYAGDSPYQGDIVVPEMVDHDGKVYQVTAIGQGAFSSYKITSVMLPASVQAIGEIAFSGASIKSIQLPASLKKIDTMAFYETYLEAIDLPEGLQEIGYDAFSGTPLTSVVIPSTVTVLGLSPFRGCGYSFSDYKSYGLKSIVVSEGNPVYDSRDNYNAIIETSTNTLLLGAPTTIIPENVERIGANAFFNIRGMETIYLPPSVSNLEESCLSYCFDFKDIYVANPEPPNGDLPFGRPTDGFRFKQVVLHVPVGSLEKYTTANYWKEFLQIVEFDPDNFVKPSGLTVPILTERDKALQYFSTDGIPQALPHQGINIVRRTDGSTQKIFVK